MARILVVEDHAALRASLADCLTREAHAVTTATNLAEARAAVERQWPDLVVLDWMLPDGQGIDLLPALRGRAPVILLTARAEVIDRVLGLELGAADYLTKPFDPRELAARVRARLRDTKPAEAALPLRAGSLEIDRVRHRVTLRGNSVDLVKKEFELLALLAETPGKVFSRDEILNKVWGYEVFPATRTVDTHVALLRNKLGDSLIETVRAVGYRFVCPN